MSDVEIIHQPSSNWSNVLDQVKREYETNPAMGVYHGLQKDAIQNGWGARSTKHGQGWSFNFKLVKTSDNQLLLTMTDLGTTGLIGQVYDHMNPTLPDEIPENEKLARFECMYDSGGGIGPGLFGRGKLLFNVASKQHLIYFDSLTGCEEYRFGYRHIKGRKCDQFRSVQQGASAQTQLQKRTKNALQPLQQPGTRITIVNPISEVVDSIHNGTFLKAIEETWWEIIQKYNAWITVTDEKGKTSIAQIPQEFSSFPMNDRDGWRVYYQSKVEVQIRGYDYKIKHLHLLVSPANHPLRPELRGVAVHRRGMKVGLLPLRDVPEPIINRFFGYVQLNPNFEDLIAEAENTTHYTFARRHNPAYRELKKTVQEHFNIFMRRLGYGTTAKNEDQKAKKILDDAKSVFDSVLENLGVPGFGTGRANKERIIISVKDLVFPGGSNCVELGTIISGFKYKLINKFREPKTIWIEVFTREREFGIIETLLPKSKVKVRKRYETAEITLKVKKGMYPRSKKVACTARVTDEQQNKLAEKTFNIFIELPPPSVEELASAVLVSADWPRAKSRRVNFNQSIRNLVYDIENLTSIPMKIRLKVGTIWAEERERIDTVSELVMNLSPFEKDQANVSEVAVTREKYSEVGRGKMFLRCHAVALETTNLWEKAKRLAENNVSFYLNMDPRYGFFEDPVFSSDGPTKPRSRAEPVEGLQRWRICINKTHPAYQDVWTKGDELTKDYIVEEMARQTVFVLLHRNLDDKIKELAGLNATENLHEMEPDDVVRLLAYPITDKILAEYY